MHQSFDLESMKTTHGEEIEFDDATYKKRVMTTPYIFICFIASFFLSEDEDIISSRSMVLKDYEKLINIGHKLELDRVPVYQMFTKTFKVK